MIDKGNKKGILSPRQIKFIEFYSDIESDSFGNAKKSALKAKYSESQADIISTRLPEKVRKELSDGLSGEEIKVKVIEKLDWLISTLKDAGQRKEMGISVDNCIKSLELLGKWQKLFTDRVEISGGITITGVLPGERIDKQVIDAPAAEL